jgi:hypothetical protein
MKKQSFTWHVVSNEDGVVLGVYGEALLSMAQECCQRIEAETGLHAFLHHIVSTNRPHVGGYISTKGAKRAG